MQRLRAILNYAAENRNPAKHISTKASHHLEENSIDLSLQNIHTSTSGGISSPSRRNFQSSNHNPHVNSEDSEL